MLKRLTALLLFIVVFVAAALPVGAASEPVLPRVYRPVMSASVAEYKGNQYIALDISIKDITDPTGLLSIGFNVLFDGDALVPLWQTDKELNGDGTMAGKYNPPQMITNWPTFNFSFGGQNHVLYAAEGLCKSYEKTGKGILNVNLVVNIDYVSQGVTEDDALSLRLYFTPVDGFDQNAVFTFTIDGQYEETAPQRVGVEGTNNARPMPQRVLGYGAQAVITLWGAINTECDLNNDGCTDNTDAALVLKYDAGIIDLDDSMLEIADINQDGYADNGDASIILKIDAGLI